MVCKKLILSATERKRKNSAGFTLLESLLAIGILVTVFAQIVGVQASSHAVAKSAKANIQATWALRALSAQIEYMADVKGVKGLPPDSSTPNTIKLNGDDAEPLRFEYKNKQTLIKASKFILASMRMGQGLSGASDEGGDNEKFKSFGDLLDSQLPDDIYRSITLSAVWNDGQQQRSMDLGMLLIDRKAVQIGIPGLTK